MTKRNAVLVIEPSSKLSGIKLKEIWRFKDLFYFMVLRDVTVLYKQTVLGFAWALISPLFQIIVFSIVFGKLAGVRPDISSMPYPVFSSLAVIPWSYFSNSLSLAGGSLISASSIFTKVYFPRIIIPLTPVFSKLVDFFISLLILCGLMIYYKYTPGHNLIFFLVPLLLIMITSAGLGFWFSSLSIQYRDFKFALTFLMPLLMYAAPVAFPASMVAEKFGANAYYFYSLYPLVGGIEGFRSCFADHPMPWQMIGIGYLSALMILLSGTFYFRKMEKYFADVA